MNTCNISLYYYIVAVEEMNFTRAASKLYITQQSLSKHIAKLERQYNTVLFERSPHLRLTQAGERMYHYAKNVIEAEKNLVAFVQDPEMSTAVRLPLGISSLKGHILLPHILQEYRKICSNVIPSIHDGNAYYMNTLLQSGRIDLYFVMRNTNIYYGEYVALQNDEMYFMVNEQMLRDKFGSTWSGFVDKHIDGVDAGDICGFPVTFPSTDSQLNRTLNLFFEKASVRPNIYAETNNYLTMFRLVSQGQCACLASKMFLYDMQSSFTPSQCPILSFRVKNIAGLSSLNIVYDTRAEKSVHVMAFIDCAKKAAAYVDRQTDEFLREQFAGY